MEANRGCYTFQELEFNDGFLQESVDATYILTMENSPRIESVMAQLSKFHPTNRVYIVVNKGFKACKKDLINQTSMYDIIDANLQVFNHAKANSYKNILVLEDDFIFNSRILEDSVNNHLNTFMKQRQADPFIYTLGCLPVAVAPYNFHTYRVLWGFAMHAVVYSNPFRETILTSIQSTPIHDWDMDISKICFKNMNKFMYKIPLCYQTIPETENKQNWGTSAPLKYLANTYIQATSFDTQPEPGTSILYMITNLLFLLLIMAILVSLYYISVLFRRNTTLIRSLQRIKSKFR